MKKLSSMIIMILIGVLIGAFLFFGMVNLNIVQSEPEITGTVVVRELESASSLITTKYNYSKVGKFENSLEVNGWSIPLTGKYFILTYDGQMLLGCDLEKAEVDINAGTKTLTVTLDPVEVLANTIDENSIEVYDESKNIFNPISIDDYKTFATSQKEQIEKEIYEKAIYDEAISNTRESVTQILNLVDGIRDVYTVNVEFREEAASS